MKLPQPTKRPRIWLFQLGGNHHTYISSHFRSFTFALFFFRDVKLEKSSWPHINKIHPTGISGLFGGICDIMSYSHPGITEKSPPLHSNQPKFFWDVGRSYRTSTWSYFPNCGHQLPPSTTRGSALKTPRGGEAKKTEMTTTAALDDQSKDTGAPEV